MGPRHRRTAASPHGRTRKSANGSPPATRSARTRSRIPHLPTLSPEQRPGGNLRQQKAAGRPFRRARPPFLLSLRRATTRRARPRGGGRLRDRVRRRDESRDLRREPARRASAGTAPGHGVQPAVARAHRRTESGTIGAGKGVANPMTATITAAPPATVVSRYAPMHILLATHFFYPDIGGLETVARVLADEFTALGTRSSSSRRVPGRTRRRSTRRSFAFPVVRRPGRRELLSLVRWCDVYFQNNISLRTLWPLLLVRRPVGRLPPDLADARGRPHGLAGPAQETAHPLRLAHRHQPRGGRAAAGARHAHRQPVPGPAVPPAARRGAHEGHRVPGAAGLGQGRRPDPRSPRADASCTA